MEGILSGKSGKGLNINGIIKEYEVQAGEEISVGDFIAFVETVSTSISLLDSASYSDTFVKAFKLSDTKVVLLHQCSSNIRATVVSIEGTTIKQLTNSILCSSVGNFGGFSEISKGYYFLSYGAGDSCYLTGKIVKVNENGTTEAGSEFTLCSTYMTGLCSIPIAISSTSVIVIHNYDTSNLYLYATACTVNTSTLSCTSKGSMTQLCTGMLASQTMSGIKVSDGKAIAMTDYVVNGYLGSYVMAYVLSTSGNTISVKTTSIYSNSLESAFQPSGITMLGSHTSYGIMAHLFYSSNSNKDVMIRPFYTSGTTITTYEGVPITNVGKNRFLFPIGNTSYALFLYNSYSGNYLRARVIYSTGTTIKVGDEHSFGDSNSGSYFSAYAPSENNITIYFGQSTNRNLSCLRLMLNKNTLMLEKTAKLDSPLLKKTTTLPFYGVAKGNGTGGNTIKVYTL